MKITVRTADGKVITELKQEECTYLPSIDHRLKLDGRYWEVISVIHRYTDQEIWIGVRDFKEYLKEDSALTKQVEILLQKLSANAG
jgi:hypothetical protein